VPAPFRYDRSFDFRVRPRDLWSVLIQTDRYPEWWPWLRGLDGAELHVGAVAHCVVQGPLPYTLRFDVVVESVVPQERIATQVRGDLSGPAVLEVASHPDGSSARLQWALELQDRVLRPLARFARPAMVWAHDRVIEVGLREFERVALNGDAPAQ
jgi:uncharacterized protein YndB with AHSA1/START domain